MRRWTAIVWDWVYLTIPSGPWRRPSPEAPIPPMGAAVEPHAAA